MILMARSVQMTRVLGQGERIAYADLGRRVTETLFPDVCGALG
jgi:hypothetical protein